MCSLGGVLKSDKTGCKQTFFTPASCTDADVRADKLDCESPVFSPETSVGAGDQKCSLGGALVLPDKTSCKNPIFQAARCINADVKADQTGCELPSTKFHRWAYGFDGQYSMPGPGSFNKGRDNKGCPLPTDTFIHVPVGGLPDIALQGSTSYKIQNGGGKVPSSSSVTGWTSSNPVLRIDRGNGKYDPFTQTVLDVENWGENYMGEYSVAYVDTGLVPVPTNLQLCSRVSADNHKTHQSAMLWSGGTAYIRDQGLACDLKGTCNLAYIHVDHFSRVLVLAVHGPLRAVTTSPIEFGKGVGHQRIMQAQQVLESLAQPACHTFISASFFSGRRGR